MIEQVTLTLPKIGCQGRMKKVVAASGTVNGVYESSQSGEEPVLLLKHVLQAGVQKATALCRGLRAFEKVRDDSYKAVPLRYEANHTEIVQIEAALQAIGHVIGKREVAGESSSFSLA
jgi:hypothetical protein